MVIWCAHYLMISDMSLPFPFHVIEGKNIRWLQAICHQPKKAIDRDKTSCCFLLVAQAKHSVVELRQRQLGRSLPYCNFPSTYRAWRWFVRIRIHLGRKHNQFGRIGILRWFLQCGKEYCTLRSWLGFVKRIRRNGRRHFRSQFGRLEVGSCHEYVQWCRLQFGRSRILDLDRQRDIDLIRQLVVR